MAMDVGGAKGGVKSDINVTPLVDVMLVLLIIMMLVAPLLQKGVDVRLPEAGNTAEKPDTQEQTVVAVDAQNNFHVNGLQVLKQDLATKVQNALEERRDRVVYLKADKEAQYGAIMAAMDDLRKAGIEDLALITDPKKDATAPGTGAQGTGGQ
jgi:biopolymer transport protein ExbD